MAPHPTAVWAAKINAVHRLHQRHRSLTSPWHQELVQIHEHTVMLPQHLHLKIMIACEFAGFIIGAITVGILWVAGQLGDRVWLAGIALCCSVLAGAVIPRIIFRKILPAHCNDKNCGGRAFPRGSDPITYVCSRCGNITTTIVSERNGHDRWNDK